MLEGRGPSKPVPASSMDTNLTIPPNVEGRGPLSASPVFCMIKRVIDVKLPMDSGNVPVNALLPRYKYVSDLIPPNVDGKGPVS